MKHPWIVHALKAIYIASKWSQTSSQNRAEFLGRQLGRLRFASILYSRAASSQPRPVNMSACQALQCTHPLLTVFMHNIFGGCFVAGSFAMVYSKYTKRRILFHQEVGLGVTGIVSVLEGINVSKSGVSQFLKRHAKSRSLLRAAGSGRSSIVTNNVKRIVDQQMEKDDETTARELVKLLQDNGQSVSESTVLRCRTMLGWTWRGSAYCQFIREGNKVKRY